MTICIKGLEVNQVLSKAITIMLREGRVQNSRNGRVLSIEQPVSIEYERPKLSTLLSPTRDANPFFHVMESMWMLQGRDDLAWPLRFNSNFKDYSDDGKTCWGAYGKRWREWFGYDQINWIIDELTRDPKSRRCVLQMWDGAADVEKLDEGRITGIGAKDVPCNTTAYFRIVKRAGELRLDMTVSNRSNDMMWGAIGANAVHFAMLQKYIAESLKMKIGMYTQFTNNLHVYLDIFPREKLVKIQEESIKAYEKVKCLLWDYAPYGGVAEACIDEIDVPFFSTTKEKFDKALTAFMRYGAFTPPSELDDSPFLKNVALPMLMCWEKRKNKDAPMSEYAVANIKNPLWRRACVEWLSRRSDNV